MTDARRAEPAKVGIIMPYTMQVKHIYILLHAGLVDVIVSSIKQFQGQVRMHAGAS